MDEDDLGKITRPKKRMDEDDLGKITRPKKNAASNIT
jgi:hypothetical protein